MRWSRRWDIYIEGVPNPRSAAIMASQMASQMASHDPVMKEVVGQPNLLQAASSWMQA